MIDVCIHVLTSPSKASCILIDHSCTCAGIPVGGPVQCTVNSVCGLPVFQRLTIPSTCPERFAKLMSECWDADPKVSINFTL